MGLQVRNLSLCSDNSLEVEGSLRRSDAKRFLTVGGVNCQLMQNLPFVRSVVYCYTKNSYAWQHPFMLMNAV